MIKKIFLSILFVFFLIITPIALAAEDPSSRQRGEFATSYDVTYDVSLDGVTTVTQKITLKNLTSQYYATSLSLTIGSTQISDTFASDPAGPMEVKQELKGSLTTITVKFNQQVAGLGKTLPWTLTFKSKDFATPLGKVWEVSIPKVVETPNLESYEVSLAVPLSFGLPTSISPSPRSKTQSFNKLFLTFDKEQLLSSGVSASFGELQLFDFDLTYHLQNSGLKSILTNIALPPDTAYQDVIYQRIIPQPLNVTVDDDGNYLAWYKLSRGQKLDAKVTGSAKLYTRSNLKDPHLPQSLYQKYTGSAKYWEKDHPTIKTKIPEILKGKESASIVEKAQIIHRFVVNNLKYNPARLAGENIDRFGAVTALNNPTSAVCMEYTDLFITLARAAGIPARELNGFAYTVNPSLRPLSLSKDILHAWPEFWDEKRGWVMIDPTWESTTGGVDYFNKLDLNHFVFVIKGLSSEQPVPAGSYKYIGQETRDVKVVFAQKDFLGKSQLEVTITTPKPIVAGLPAKVMVKMVNLGNALYQAANFQISAKQLTFLENTIQNSGPIPAFGHAEFEYNIRTKSLLDFYDDTIEVLIAGQKFHQDIEVKPFIIFRHFPWMLLGLIGLIGLVYLTVLGGFIYRRRILKSGTNIKK